MNDYGEIVILGSTGSIGRQSIDVASKLGISVAAVTGGKNVGLMEQQLRQIKPRYAAMADENATRELRIRTADLGIPISSGEAGLIEAAELSGTKTVITAVSGTAGLRPTMAAIKAGKRIALANKETLVCAGSLVMREIEKNGNELIPVDSEHSAIFQSLRAGEHKELKRILLTCSGGPFRGKKAQELENVTAAMALKHPNWSMGNKITIDSATLMNKGLEVIEAMHLFKMPLDSIKVLVHPQSVIHSAVEFCDNAVIAQMGTPDMRLPIEFALTWPDRAPAVADELDLVKIAMLTFEEPDREAFPCLALAEQCARKGGNRCAVMNAANEEAVALFLKDRIRFMDIYRLCAEAVDKLGEDGEYSIDGLLDIDAQARRTVRENII